MPAPSPFNDQDMVEIIDKLRRTMQSKQVGQKKLQKLTGVHRVTIQAILKLGMKPSLDTLQRLARGLEVDVQELIPDRFKYGR